MALSTALTFGPHWKRWYVAETPNMASDVAMEHRAGDLRRGGASQGDEDDALAIANGTPRVDPPAPGGPGLGRAGGATGG